MLQYFHQPVNNAPLIFFRWAFGFLIAVESWGAIGTGWVHRAMIEPTFNFTFMQFEWLQPLPGNGMYFYYAFMGLLGILIMAGVYYRYSLGLFTLLWWGVYLMQKSHYNNHYYLLILICLLMLIVPAAANGSWDARRHPGLRSNYCPRWCLKIFQYLLLIVYTYAGLAKLYPGWWEGHFISLAFAPKASWFLVGPLLQEAWFQKIVIIGGIAFDLTIVPLLLIRRTRIVGVVFSFIFHLFNAVIFGIGIFPFLMLASLFFFYPMTKAGQKWLPQYQQEPNTFKVPKILGPALMVFFTVQLLLPLRHHLFQGDVLRTEEGHRMSWRMMLRSKSGVVRFKVVDKTTGKEQLVHPKEYLTSKQATRLATHPDMIWQFSRFLQKELQKRGSSEIEIYALSQVSINGSPMQPMIDPEVDLLSVQWHRFKHNPWILTE